MARDDDGTGSLSIAELADFVERGAATFNAGPDEGEQDERVAGLKWGERSEDSAELKAAKAETAAKAARAKEKPPAAVELPQVSRKDLPKALNKLKEQIQADTADLAKKAAQQEKLQAAAEKIRGQLSQTEAAKEKAKAEAEAKTDELKKLKKQLKASSEELSKAKNSVAQLEQELEQQRSERQREYNRARFA